MPSTQKMHLDTVIPVTVSQMGFLMLIQGFVLNAGLSHLATNHSDAVWVAVCLGVSGFILQGSAIYSIVSRYVEIVWICKPDSLESYRASAGDLRSIVGFRVVSMLIIGTFLGLGSMMIYISHLGSHYGTSAWMLIVPVVAVLWTIGDWLADKFC